MSERMSEPTPQTEWVELDVDDGTRMRAHVTRPGGDGRFPGMLLFQEALGVGAQLRGVAARLAGRGFVVVAPELYHRTAPGFELDTLDMSVLMPLIRSVTAAGMTADARAAHGWLASQPDVDAGRVAALGFCMGGRAAWLANAALPLAAAVSYYGGRIAPDLLDRAASLSGPHLFLWGGRDASIPPEQHRAVVDAVRAAGKPFVDVEFSEATHAFFNERTDRWDPAAAAQSWAIATAFLDDALTRAP
jgi:carboxymethylenebutenolidase